MPATPASTSWIWIPASRTASLTAICASSQKVFSTQRDRQGVMPEPMMATSLTVVAPELGLSYWPARRAGCAATPGRSVWQSAVRCARQMSQLPDRQASAKGICASSRKARATDGQYCGGREEGRAGRDASLTVILLVRATRCTWRWRPVSQTWLASASRHPGGGREM